MQAGISISLSKYDQAYPSFPFLVERVRLLELGQLEPVIDRLVLLDHLLHRSLGDAVEASWKAETEIVNFVGKRHLRTFNTISRISEWLKKMLRFPTQFF